MAQDLLLHVEGKAVVADTGYDSDEIRDSAKALEIDAVIHPHPNRKKKPRLKRRLYKLRYRVECCFHDLKHFRAVATRYDKTAVCYLATLHVAAALLWLR